MKPQRLDLCYHIVWRGRWHVGSGYQSAVADRLVQRLLDGAPFVPGSQIKGVLRHQWRTVDSCSRPQSSQSAYRNRERRTQSDRIF